MISPDDAIVYVDAHGDPGVVLLDGDTPAEVCAQSVPRPPSAMHHRPLFKLLHFSAE
jgi:hypothetical protein